MSKKLFTVMGAIVLAAGCSTPAKQPASIVSLSVRDGATEAISNQEHASISPVSHQESVSHQEVDSSPPLPAQVPERVPTPEPQTDAPANHVPYSLLTLPALEEMALTNNPAISEASAKVEAARGNWLQVGLPPNPQIAYSGQEIGGGGQAGQQGGYVQQTFVTGKKLKLNRDVASWQVRRAEQELAVARLRVLTDIRIAYYNVLVAQRRRELAGRLVDISTKGEQAARALFRGGEVSEADPLRARIEVDSSRIVLQTAINQHLEAWRRLAAIVGSPHLPLARLDGKLDPAEFYLTWRETLQRLLAESPALAAMFSDVEAARWAVDRAYAQIVPNVQVQAGVYRDFGGRDTIASLQVQLPIPIINRNQGGIRRARANVVAAQRAADRLALDLQARQASAFQRYSSARNRVEIYSREGGILDTAERTLTLIRAGYQAEEFGLLDLLNAQRTYFQTNLAYVDSLGEFWDASIEIDGLLLRNSLQQ